jgi:pilus assembly protein CpaB
VLAVDQTASTDKNEPVIVRAVTLEMSPSQSEDLVKAKEEGKIQLTQRNPLAPDTVIVEEAPPPPLPRPVIRPPAPRPPPERTITIIRGTEVGQTKSES